MVCLVVSVALSMVCSFTLAQAQVLPLTFPDSTNQPLVVPNSTTLSDGIILDNFEYWDSPYNHGWTQLEPSYPVYGYGLGYAAVFNTVVDLQLGSRVLDVYRPASVFLIGTNYEKHVVSYNVAQNIQGLLASNPVLKSKTLLYYPMLTFDFRAPVGIESWDIFDFTVVVGQQPTGTTACPAGTCNPTNVVAIRIRPMEPPYNYQCTNCDYIAYFADQTMQVINVDIGRGYLDGSWHAVWINLLDVLYTAYAGAGLGTPPQDTVYSLSASGQMFRLDNIYLRSAKYLNTPETYLFKIGPRYAQIFQPTTYIFTANDPLGLWNLFFLDANGRMAGDPAYSSPAVLTNPADIQAYWISQGANPAYFYSPFDPNMDGYDGDGDGVPDFDPNVTAILGREHLVDPTLAVLGDPNLSKAMATTAGQALNWNATVGGVGSSGIQFFQISPLPINPYDGMPTYLPVYDKSGTFVNLFQKSYLDPQYVLALEGLLWNLGFTVWPNVAFINITPQVFEDLIMSVEVSDGTSSDMETFPVEVLNVPIENHPPYIEDTDDRLFYVGQYNQYAVGAIDPDCFIFAHPVGGNPPATTHPTMFAGQFRTDMDSLVYGLTIDGLPSYQYGPWNETIINPHTGLISFTPKFEGAYGAVLTVTDSRGASAARGFTIFCVQTGTWLNHPPIVLSDFEHPILVRAGEELVLTSPTFQIVDPDGDKVYYSTNLGSTGTTCNQNFLWKFQTNFPGYYTAEILAYDIRGGYAIVTLDVEVKPWWSYSPSAALGL